MWSSTGVKRELCLCRSKSRPEQVFETPDATYRDKRSCHLCIFCRTCKRIPRVRLVSSKLVTAADGVDDKIQSPCGWYQEALTRHISNRSDISTLCSIQNHLYWK